jgi:Mce-associated membrane protein
MYGPAAEPEPARGRNPLLYIMIALVLVLAAVAVWFVVTWVKARDDRAAATEAQAKASAELARLENDDTINFSRARDEVRRSGEADIVTFNTMDYQHVDESFDNWEKVSTGELHSEVVAHRASGKQTVENAKTRTTATILTAAVTQLDERAGSATMIAALRLEVTVEGGQPTPKHQRIQATLQRTDGGWKLSGINYVPFN